MAHSAILSGRNFQSWRIRSWQFRSKSRRNLNKPEFTIQYGSLNISLKDNCVLYRLISTCSVFSLVQHLPIHVLFLLLLYMWEWPGNANDNNRRILLALPTQNLDLVDSVVTEIVLTAAASIRWNTWPQEMTVRFVGSRCWNIGSGRVGQQLDALCELSSQRRSYIKMSH